MAGRKPSEKAVGRRTAGRQSREASAEVSDQPELAAVVGIGASAGGLEALQELFGAMPADTGMAHSSSLRTCIQVTAACCRSCWIGLPNYP